MQETMLRMAYQPIFDLRSGCVVGYEALVRGARGEFPERLFSGLNVRERRKLELEALRRAALEMPGGILFANLSPAVFSYKLGKPAWAALSSVPPDSVVVEITERLPIPENLELAVARWKEAGYRLAVDDVSDSSVSLALVFLIRPQFAKLDRRLVAGLPRDEEGFARSVVRFVHKMGVEIIAEGIETEEQLEAVKRINITWGQGYLLGMPAFLEEIRGLRKVGG